jgi:GT2 family glycosyltransferase
MVSFPRVAVVILNYNGRAYLEKFLPSVLGSSYSNLEIIVADNASTDHSIDFLRSSFPEIRLILNARNEGFAQGYNEALNHVEAEYFVLLNSDVEVHSNWIEPVIELMESQPDIAACQPKLLAQSDKKRFEYAGASGGWLDCLGYPFMRGRVFDHCEEDQGQYDDPAPCFWASGAALFVRSTAYRKVGGLDPFFFAHQEEIDLCWRLQLAGYKIFVQPKSVVYHVGGGTLPPSRKKMELNFRNNLILISKNMPLSALAWKLPARFALDALAAWRELFAGRGSYFLAIATAHFQFLQWLLFHKRKSVFPASRKTGKLNGYLKRSLVWNYFILRRRTFSEIVRNQ